MLCNEIRIVSNNLYWFQKRHTFSHLAFNLQDRSRILDWIICSNSHCTMLAFLRKMLKRLQSRNRFEIIEILVPRWSTSEYWNDNFLRVVLCILFDKRKCHSSLSKCCCYLGTLKWNTSTEYQGYKIHLWLLITSVSLWETWKS